jgi:hypothetical protein
MNNSRRIVELLTKSADLMTALRRRKQQTLWQRLHNGNAKQKMLSGSSMPFRVTWHPRIGDLRLVDLRRFMSEEEYVD